MSAFSAHLIPCLARLFLQVYAAFASHAKYVSVNYTCIHIFIYIHIYIYIFHRPSRFIILLFLCQSSRHPSCSAFKLMKGKIQAFIFKVFPHYSCCIHLSALLRSCEKRKNCYRLAEPGDILRIFFVVVEALLMPNTHMICKLSHWQSLARRT